jgi:hypothetical protein
MLSLTTTSTYKAALSPTLSSPEDPSPLQASLAPLAAIPSTPSPQEPYSTAAQARLDKVPTLACPLHCLLEAPSPLKAILSRSAPVELTQGLAHPSEALVRHSEALVLAHPSVVLARLSVVLARLSVALAHPSVVLALAHPSVVLVLQVPEGSQDSAQYQMLRLTI